MNARCFRLVFSRLLRSRVPAPETARSACGGARRASRPLAALAALAAAGIALAGPAAAQLPVPCGGGPCGTNPASAVPFAQSGAASYAINGAQAIVNQTTPKAVLNWRSFNIGAGNTVTFQQPGASAAALNRIWQADPSVIAGRLNANGQIYLINQNGIVFANGAQVNAAGIVASALDIDDAVFNSVAGLQSSPLGTDPIFTFKGSQSQYEAALIRIESGASLEGQGGGLVLVLAPRIENSGKISAKDGQVILAAGSKVYLTPPPDIDPRSLPIDSPLRGIGGLLVEVDPFQGTSGGQPIALGGEVLNTRLGRIISEHGNATLVALAVNQQGRVSATTSVRLKGSVRLLARDTKDAVLLPGTVQPIIQGNRTGTLTAGAQSVTEVLPDLNDTATTQDSQLFNPSTVELAGKTIGIEGGAQIRVPGGYVNATAQSGLQYLPKPAGSINEPRIDVGAGALIDVSGTSSRTYGYWNEFLVAAGRNDEVNRAGELVIPVERNFIEVLLLGNEFKDAPLQRSGPLLRQKVWIDVRKGTPLADVSGFLGQIERPVGERLLGGGTAQLRSEGDIVLREGATVDVSGGQLRYTAGYSRTTLLSANGRLVDISEASPDVIYSGIANVFVDNSASRWGVTQTYYARSGAYLPSDIEGGDGGTARFVAPALALNGTLYGYAVSGALQRAQAKVPLGGLLAVGEASGTGTLPPQRIPGVVFGNELLPLPDDWDPSQPLPQPWRSEVPIAVDFLRRGGFRGGEFYADGPVVVPEGVPLETPAGGELVLLGARLDVRADLRSPSGTISLATIAPDGANFSGRDLRVANGVRIDARGRWVNDTPTVGTPDPRDAPLVDGGTVTMRSASGLYLGSGSVVDVSGGGWVKQDGTLVNGDGGAILLASNVGQPAALLLDEPLVLGGELRGYALGRGGTLSLTAASVVVGSPLGAAGELALAPSFFTVGGFTRYSLTGRDSVRFRENTEVAPVSLSLVLEPGYQTRRSDSDLPAFAQPTLLPAALRNPVSVDVAATAELFDGNVRFENGSALRVDPEGAIRVSATRSIYVGGALEAPAGTVDVAIKGVFFDINEFDDSQSIWFGPQAQVRATGAVRVPPSALGLRLGEVLDGGSITVSTNQGYIVAEQGAVFDVSATQAVLDVRGQRAYGIGLVPKTVYGDAGSIAFTSREGILLDAALSGQPAGNGAGGSLSLVLDRANNFPLYRNYPNYFSVPRTVVVREGGAVVPPGLAPGDTIDRAAFNGYAALDPRGVTNGGFDELTIRAESGIVFDGRVGLSLGRSLRLETPVMTGRAGSDTRLSSGYMYFGNDVSTIAAQGVPSAVIAAVSDRLINGEDVGLPLLATQARVPAASGDAQISLEGSLIDLEGNIALQGFADARLASSGDLRLRNRLVSFSVSNLPRYGWAEGRLTTAADLTLSAAQIYPTSLAAFVFSVEDASGAPAGRLSILPGGGAPAPVLSAYGSVRFRAADIHQTGAVKAPFGVIGYEAGSLVLGPGSLSSISPEGGTIPFGRTELSGQDFVYDAGPVNQIFISVEDGVQPALAARPGAGGVTIAARPFKTVRLDAAQVDVQAGARIDLSANGDTRTYEFVPGPGGSTDILAAAASGGAFAVVPRLGSSFAPYDFQEYLDLGAYAAGERVSLSGGAGLPAGTYAVLPARYALLDGAYLVTPTPGYQDFLPVQATPLADGSVLASGRYAPFNAGRPVAQSRSSGFVVTPAAVVRTRAEYLERTGGQLYAAYPDAQQPGDAGRLVVRARDALLLNGSLTGAPAGAGFQGGQLDVVADLLAVVSAGAAAPGTGFVALDAASLRGFGAASIVLGAERTPVAGGVSLDVGAKRIVVATSADDPLSAPEVILAATDRIEVLGGSRIEGAGAASTGNRTLFVGRAGTDPVDGDGALLGVSSGALSAPIRANIDRNRGELDVAGTATIAATSSIVLDATRDNLARGALEFEGNGGAPAGRLTLGSGRVSFGEVDGVSEGLALSADQLSAFDRLSSLTVKSYSTVDLYGTFAFGSDTLELAIDAGGVGGYLGAAGANAPTITARRLTLTNRDGTAFSAAPARGDGSIPAPGTGTLTLDGGSIVLGPGGTRTAAGGAAEVAGVAIRGFSETSMTATDGLTVSGAGRTDVAGSLTVSTPRLAGEVRAAHALNVSGSLSLTGSGTEAAGEPGAGAGFAITASRILVDTVIDATAGAITLAATGPRPDDGVTLGAGAALLAEGYARAFADQRVAIDGGNVSLRAAGGDVSATPGSLIDVGAAPGGRAGSLSISAARAVALDGELRGAGEAASGRFSADLGTAPDLGAINAALDAGGFFGARGFRVRDGDVSLAAGQAVRANDVSISADHGAVTILGTLDASGASGGRIAVWGRDRVAIGGGAILDASGSGGAGGDIVLGVAERVVEANDLPGVEVASGALVKSGGTPGGTVRLRAQRIGTADVDVRVAAGTITGAADVFVEAARVYDVAPGAGGAVSIGTTSGAGLLNLNTVVADTAAYMNNAAAIKANVGIAPAEFRLQPGVEVRTAGDLRLDADWNLYSASRPGGEAGVMTWRAGGDVVFNRSLSDGFNRVDTATSLRLQRGDSWSYRLVAGADLASADPSAVLPVSSLTRGATPVGSVTVASGRLVRTGTGDIGVYAGRDIRLADTSAVIYTAGQAVDPLPDFAVRTVSSVPMEFPENGGDLTLSAGQDIVAAPPTQLVNDWMWRQGSYTNGGLININTAPAWWIRYTDFRQGVAALGGGDVSIEAGRDISNLAVSIPTTGRLQGASGTIPDPARVVITGGGDLRVKAGRDIASGVFFVGRGDGSITAGGALTSARSTGSGAPLYTVLALGDASFEVTAAGDLRLEAAINPTTVEQTSQNTLGANSQRRSYFFTYGDDSAVSLTSGFGDVRISGNVEGIKSVFTLPSFFNSTTMRVFPGTLEARAVFGDVGIDGLITLYPSARGDLQLLAGDSVRFTQPVAMSDVAPGSVPTPGRPDQTFQSIVDRVANYGAGPDLHDPGLLHLDDPSPVRIVALEGDVVGLPDLQVAILAKPAIVRAGRDIRDLSIYAQNLRAGDLTEVTAGRDLRYSQNRNVLGIVTANSGRLEVGGPGRLLVAAGRNVDLASAAGIISSGDSFNPFLPTPGADVTVLVGLGSGPDGGVLAPDYAAFAGAYLQPGSAALAAYDANVRSEALKAVRQRIKVEQPGLSAGQVEALLATPEYAQEVEALYQSELGRFEAAPQDVQAREVFFSELRESGRAAAAGSGYGRAYAAIDALFPRSNADGTARSYRGDLSLYFSQIKTEQGGNIELLVPGGLVNAGLAIADGGVNKSPAELGIITVRGGSIDGYVRDDFLVNQSRVFTLGGGTPFGGGNILLFSLDGDIDAGKGARSATATPAPRDVFRDGRRVVDFSQSIAGSGIGVLLSSDTVPPGDVDLIAPAGTVNAGEAGIRSAGNVTIAAVQVVGGDLITAGGTSVGVPAAAPAAAPVSPTNSAADAARSTDQVARSLNENAQSGQALQDALKSTFITVEVIGFGE